MTRLSVSFLTCTLFGVLAGCGSIQSREVPNPNSEDDTRYSDDDPEGRPMPEGDGKKGSGPKVNEGEARSHDTYDKEATDPILARAARSVKANCGDAAGDDGKAKGPWGKVNIVVLLGRNGHTKDVRVPEPYNGTPSGTCIERAFANLTYPPWAGADTPVDYEVELVEPKPEPKAAPKKK